MSHRFKSDKILSPRAIDALSFTVEAFPVLLLNNVVALVCAVGQTTWTSANACRHYKKDRSLNIETPSLQQ